MVNDDDRVAICEQVVYHLEKAVHVRWVKAYRGLIEHVEHARRPVAHRSGELDAL